jgi:crossover junction endodeoxyribonuclease RuvC
MIILGIDPGTATTGYGVIEFDHNILRSLGFGLIETDKNGEPASRLLEIHQEMLVILEKHKPNVIAIEKLFFATNAKTAIRVGQAQGVMLLCAASVNVPVFEYSPMTIKKLIAGNGRADKIMVQKAVRKVLGRGVRSKARKKTHFDNSADALAVALCHIYSSTSSVKRESMQSKNRTKGHLNKVTVR